MRIYTKSGDKGKTSLLGGSRVDKDDLRIECYGTLDELNSYIGLCSVYAQDYDKKILRDIQLKLFSGSAQLAPRDEGEYKNAVVEEDITHLESLMDEYISKLDKVDAFIVPGTSVVSANLHIARTICRRAERRIYSLSKIEKVNPLFLKYINRLSDLLYAIARFNETELIYVQYKNSSKK